jgi:hypothetical protein
VIPPDPIPNQPPDPIPNANPDDLMPPLNPLLASAVSA